MTLKKCFNYALAFMIALSLAISNVKADYPTEDVYPEYRAYYGNASQESVFVSALNEYRTARGLHPVAVCSELSADCRRWSSQMRQRGYLSHDPTGGIEICAQISSESGVNALQAWQRSPAHNAVLLSPRIDTIGIGSDGNWWTMRGRQGGTRHTVFRPTGVETDVWEWNEVARAHVRREIEVVVNVADVVVYPRLDEPGGRVPMSVAGRTSSYTGNPGYRPSRFR